jgi:thioredoxin reductase (NADPH)
MSVRVLIIVGAGPSGLSAAIAAKLRNLDYHVIEQGVLVNSIYRFPPQMVFFTTPELLEIGGLPFMSPFEKPTRAEALNYYRKVVDKYDLRIAYEETVTAISRETAPGEDPVFAVETRSSRPGRAREPRACRGARGATVRYARHRDVSCDPGAAGHSGRPHVHRYYSEPHVYYRQRVVVVGANSAAEASLEMHRAGARVTLVHRGAELVDERSGCVT